MLRAATGGVLISINFGALAQSASPMTPSPEFPAAAPFDAARAPGERIVRGGHYIFDDTPDGFRCAAD